MGGDLKGCLLICGVLLVVTGCWPIPNRLSVSPDGWLALTMSEKTDGSYEALPHEGQIWLVDSKTGRVQAVFHGSGSLSWAAFSPDGTELLYVDSPSFELPQILRVIPSRPWRLLLFDRRSNTTTELLSGDHGFIWAPTFSPDGRKIAYYRGDGKSQIGLYIFDRDAYRERLVRLVQDDKGLYYAPYGPGLLWTPDGRGIFVFFVEKLISPDIVAGPGRDFMGRLAVLDVECGCERTISAGFFPLWPVPLSLIASPDGQRLYVNGYDQTTSGIARERVNLYEIAVETGQKITLYDQGGIALAPALSPEGTRLLFTVISLEEPMKADLYVIDRAQETPVHQLTYDRRSGFGFWLSQEEIGFVRLRDPTVLRGEIWIKNLFTNEERNLTALLAVQSPLAQLSQQLQDHQQQMIEMEQALERVESQLHMLHHTIAALPEALQGLSQKLDAVQTQSTEINNQIAQRTGDLMADMSVVKTQLSSIETEVKALSLRPTLSLWQLVTALLLAVIVIVLLVRRAVHALAQQIALPPQ